MVKGETLVLHPIMTPANSTDTISWISGNENIATVDVTGCVNAKTTGLVAMKCTTSSGKSYTFSINVVSSGETTVDNEPDKKITLSAIEGIENKEYTGNALTQELKVKFNAYTELIENVHYKVSYKNNTDIGTATVTITAISGSGYTGTITKTFEITGYTGMREINGSWYYLVDSKVATSYTGLAKNPYGWWHMTNGKLDLTYTGLSKNQYGWWYVKDGKLDLTYTGKVIYKGVTFNVKKGKVIM